MTSAHRPGNRSFRVRLAPAVVWLCAFAAGSACRGEENPAPRAEFIVAAGDSTYWIRSDRSGIALRGTPMVLARLEGRFRELYVVDDDQSFENAVFVGQALYQRDLESGDSTELFRDTLVARLARAYAESHPDARRLAPDEETGDEPATTATADISVLAVHGPYLSLEYHADTSGTSDDAWHMTRHVVLDLRSGKRATLDDVLGVEEARSAVRRARALYEETVDSIRRDRRAAAQRAARSLGRFHFDPNNFSLTAPNGTLMIAFSAPGQGAGGEGFTMPIRPIPVREPGWWSDARSALPTSTQEREEHWSRGAYVVKAAYDTTAEPVRLTLVDSARREFQVGGVAAPVHRIYWLDQPPIAKSQRSALQRAFDEAALYDGEAVRAAGAPAPSGMRVAARP